MTIHDKDAMEQFPSRFPNANELSLTTDFKIACDSIVNGLNRIIPLQQITRLILQCHRLSCKKFLELLHGSPHIHTLEVHSSLIYPVDSSTFMQKNKLCKLISDTNIVANVVIEKEILLKNLQFLVALFPRLESLTLHFRRETLEPIVSFLLSKMNQNTRRLSFLFISTRDKTLVAYLRNVIESNDLLHCYTLKQINQKLCLWW